MRFYIPGTVLKTDPDKGEAEDEKVEGEEEGEGEEPAEEQNAANLFYDTLLDKAEIGEIAGDTFATFLDVLHLTPRSASTVRTVRLSSDADVSAEVDSMSTCTKAPSDCAARRTITRFSIKPSKNSSYSRKMTIRTPLSPSDWTLHYDKDRRGTRSWLCNLSSTRRLASISI